MIGIGICSLFVPVAKLVYACGLGPHPERGAGSSPARDTLKTRHLRRVLDYYVLIVI